MIWKTSQLWDTRIRRSFTWLPTDCTDGQTRWLVRIVRLQIFVGAFYFFDGWLTVWSGTVEQLAEHTGPWRNELDIAAKVIGRLRSLHGGGYQPVESPSELIF